MGSSLLSLKRSLLVCCSALLSNLTNLMDFLVTMLDRISITQNVLASCVYFLWEEYSKAVVVVVVKDDDEIRERLDEHNYWQN